jgi:4-amino-4-deoxy-L-arabinose transferase-like glycosyltransferase
MPSQLAENAEQRLPAAVTQWIGRLWKVGRSLPRKAMTRAALPYWSVFFALLAGLALRLLFVLRYPSVDSDTDGYAALARNMLLHHAYAMDAPYHLTLFRLPGYPIFLAVIFKIWGMNNLAPVMPIQVGLDLASCLLIAGFVRDHVSRRAAQWALWLVVLCPFTANYTAIALTECNSIFCVALGVFAAGRLIRGIRSQGRIPWGYLALTAAALAWAILFRPDGGLLSAAIVPGIWWYTRRAAPRASWRAALLCALLVTLPFIPWTIRNYRVFHVFQPLAPRYANDPGESPIPGFMRWTRTWLGDFVSVPEIWWNGDSLPIDIHLLPSRAFDSPEEYRQTEKLLLDYNQDAQLTPEMDGRFDALGWQRIGSHPFRYYVTLPLARMTDIWLRPRTELLWDQMPIRWWEWSKHPFGSLCAIGYGLLNAALLVLAAIAFISRRVPFPAMLGAYVIFRSMLMLFMENSEPRYALEAFPIVLIAAALTLAPRPRPGLEPA